MTAADKAPPGLIERRAEERTDVNWIAQIRVDAGPAIPCSVKNISKTGMKLVVAADQALSDSFTLKVIGKDLVFRLRRIWRLGSAMGVAIDQIAKLPPKQDGPDTASGGRSSVEQAAAVGGRRLYSTGR